MGLGSRGYLLYNSYRVLLRRRIQYQIHVFESIGTAGPYKKGPGLWSIFFGVSLRAVLDVDNDGLNALATLGSIAAVV